MSSESFHHCLIRNVRLDLGVGGAGKVAVVRVRGRANQGLLRGTVVNFGSRGR